ncbi:hypothetical protein K438DRAFT_1662168 [Mycena galopus ATCC 62051]|nr:hypothetical protein K438DRAFT_1662168 [Mycena galopus ATCC 62051]
MVRILSVVCTVFLAAFAVGAPLGVRQVGDLQCNEDRLATVSGLAATTAAVKKIDTTDPTTASAVTAAQAGLQSASQGIAGIAKALVAGQTAPAADRTQVGAGLTAAQTALTGINDPAASDAVTTALGKLSDTITAGQGVATNCT